MCPVLQHNTTLILFCLIQIFSSTMKFGKRLRRECHAEWVQYYLDYKELKKTIKNIVAEGSGMRKLLKHPIRMTRYCRIISLSCISPRNIPNMRPSLTIDTKQFFVGLDAELEKLNDFFCGRVALFEEMFPFMAGRLEQVWRGQGRGGGGGGGGGELG